MRESVLELQKKAIELRKIALKMAHTAGSEGAHIGPAFSLMDIMAVLFFDTMNYRVSQPDWPDRDRLILSKGHACLGLYAPLVLSGLMTQEQADTFNQPHTHIAGHPSGKGVHGIEHPAGSLGHGLSVGCGIAKGAKLNRQGYHTYVVLGDGESNEGSVWEAVMFAAQHKLDNLVAVVDVNGFQFGGTTMDLMNMEPMADKWKAFGWHVLEVNGNDIAQLQKALDPSSRVQGMPTCVIARTVKGYGVDRFAGNNDWHHGTLDQQVLTEALEELDRQEERLK